MEKGKSCGYAEGADTDNEELSVGDMEAVNRSLDMDHLASEQLANEE
jgi:hypothetical protein